MNTYFDRAIYGVTVLRGVFKQRVYRGENSSRFKITTTSAFDGQSIFSNDLEKMCVMAAATFAYPNNLEGGEWPNL